MNETVAQLNDTLKTLIAASRELLEVRLWSDHSVEADSFQEAVDAADAARQLAMLKLLRQAHDETLHRLADGLTSTTHQPE